MYIEDLKFSLWADFIERDFLDNEFQELIDAKIVNGATSNPAIFKNAILNSPAYLTQLQELEDLEPKQKYEAVAIYDIQKAADIMRPLFDKGDDGYVSIEVDPHLCDDTEGTIEEGKRLFAAINRPNVMIKVPATDAGYGAMEALTAEGIPVNATLIFKKSQAIECAEAFKKGGEKHGSKVDTVISIFVSRVDRAIDKHLKEHGIEVALSGIYNSADIYNEIEAMQVPGCRTLFASTGVKDDSLPAHYYVEQLLAYNSVNTAPIDTIKAFHENGSKNKVLPIESQTIQAHFDKIADIGLDFDAVLTQQIEDGLEAFKDAFQEILGAL
ncbi:transaldolase [Sulfurimonas marina]|uniref:Transaldolase n=1 Tax=Sulfurimonas marina TaxID=2590551 RepID=A0A7M1ATA8_9BACT|nr:transaldolase [Sulfurimonas marina]QOP40655.1 transaldolase [Sulfurimonas marina]